MIALIMEMVSLMMERRVMMAMISFDEVADVDLLDNKE